MPVGLPPHDFALRVRNEDDHRHVATSGRSSRSRLPEAAWPPKKNAKPDDRSAREGIRSINAEPLREPVPADLGKSSEIYAHSPEAKGVELDEKNADGPLERVDPIDADIAVASDGGLAWIWLYLADDKAGRWEMRDDWEPNPAPEWFHGSVQKADNEIQRLTARLNEGRTAGEEPYVVRAVFRCFKKDSLTASGYLVEHRELVDQARKRWRNSLAPKSFHGAIIGAAHNHKAVTAFDVSIGGGKAISHQKSIPISVQ